MIKFYDTCALLTLQKSIFESEFVISNISISELEQIKTSGTRDEDIKWSARQLLKLLDQNEDKYQILIYNEEIGEKTIQEYNLTRNNDGKIVASAINYHTIHADSVFVTCDLSCKTMARAAKIPVESGDGYEDEEEYSGYKIVELNDIQLANFYSSYVVNAKNVYDLYDNQYLLIKNNSKIIDKYKWLNNQYVPIPFYKAQSRMFGKVTPKDNDVFQQIALDSLFTNQITMLRGPAGTGKSYLSFGYMFDLLEQGKIDKIVIFCNTVATKGSAKLGFYPGSRTEKLLDSQIGNLLESKLGDRVAVERLIDDGALVLLPMSDIRGYDTTGMNAAIYISEAQNLDIELMRLALQRIGEDSICIIDGDFAHQVDMAVYAGKNNGMRRVSEVFRGQNFYGEVVLQKIYRSKIAEIAEKL